MDSWTHEGSLYIQFDGKVVAQLWQGMHLNGAH